MMRSTLAGRHAANDFGAVLNHLLSMETAFAAREALDDDASFFVDKNAHVNEVEEVEEIKEIEEKTDLISSAIPSIDCGASFLTSSIPPSIARRNSWLRIPHPPPNRARISFLPPRRSQ